jgi:hypothetical protein
MNEIAAALGFVPPIAFPAGLDCRAYLPLTLESGAEIDCCVLCGVSADEHAPDDIDDDIE